MAYCYEMMGLTWLARSPDQSDAILIGNEIFQESSKITDLYQFRPHDSWCVAVADGEKGIHDYANISIDVLEIINKQWMESSEIDFCKIQQYLSQKYSERIGFLGSNSTVALVTNTPRMGYLRIQHLGDSRVYGFSHFDQTWRCLTTDHTLLAELSKTLQPKENEVYPKVFNRLICCFSAFSSSDLFEKDSGSDEYRLVQDHQMFAHDALLICSKGVHEVLRNSKFWRPFNPEVTHLEWLMAMKKRLIQYGAYDNASMILIRLNVE